MIFFCIWAGMGSILTILDGMKKFLIHSARSEKPLCHSARSEAQLQNLLNNRQNIFSSKPKRFCDCAQNDSVFFDKMVDALRLSTLPDLSFPRSCVGMTDSNERDYAGQSSLPEVCRQWWVSYAFPRRSVGTRYGESAMHSHTGAWERDTKTGLG